MARLKRDHSNWGSYGLYMKYKQPKVNDISKKGAAKKNTNKWCRGKIGTEHKWERFQRKHYNWETDDYVDPYVHIKCVECKKEKYAKTAKAANFRVHLWIDYKSEGYEPIQVRLNGKYLPIFYTKYYKGKYFCYTCGYWH